MSIRREDYCCESLELVESYSAAKADDFQGWDIHHRGEILPCGRFSTDDLKKFDLYWNRPASELIWLRHDEHIAMHSTGNSHAKGNKQPNKGKHLSEETRQKISSSVRKRFTDQAFKQKATEAATAPEVIAKRVASWKKTVSNWTPEQKQAFSQKASEANKGRKQSTEEKEKRSNSVKKFYQEHPEKREDWSKHFKSVKRTESWCKNISKSLCKSLTATDVKTREEHHFSSLAEACEFLQARVYGNISTAIKTKKPYRGFYWSRP